MTMIDAEVQVICAGIIRSADLAATILFAQHLPITLLVDPIELLQVIVALPEPPVDLTTFWSTETLIWCVCFELRETNLAPLRKSEVRPGWLHPAL